MFQMSGGEFGRKGYSDSTKKRKKLDYGSGFLVLANLQYFTARFHKHLFSAGPSKINQHDKNMYIVKKHNKPRHFSRIL